MSYRIYLVEDEVNLNELLASYLAKEGWEMVSFLNGESARQAISEHPHLWILDIMLPDIDGYQLLREIKADLDVMPIIYISARDAELDRVIGLEMGSDVIRSYAQAIADGVFPRGGLEGSIQVIDEEAERLEKRVRDLLYLNKINYLSAHPQADEEIILEELIQKIINLLRWQRTDLFFISKSL